MLTSTLQAQSNHQAATGTLSGAAAGTAVIQGSDNVNVGMAKASTGAAVTFRRAQ